MIFFGQAHSHNSALRDKSTVICTRWLSHTVRCVCTESNTGLINDFGAGSGSTGWNHSLSWDETCRSKPPMVDISGETIRDENHLFREKLFSDKPMSFLSCFVLSAVQRLANTSSSSPNHSWRHAISSGYTVWMACAVSRKTLDGVLIAGRARAGLKPFQQKVWSPDVVLRTICRLYYQEKTFKKTRYNTRHN